MQTSIVPVVRTSIVPIVRTRRFRGSKSSGIRSELHV